MTRYAINKGALGNLDARSAALVAFLLGKVRNKPQKYTLDQLNAFQRLCLLTDKQITGNVINWWKRRRA